MNFLGIADIAEDKGIDRCEALEKLLKAYDLHRELRGSAKGLVGEEYAKRMQERYDFVYEQVIGVK